MGAGLRVNVYGVLGHISTAWVVQGCGRWTADCGLRVAEQPTVGGQR